MIWPRRQPVTAALDGLVGHKLVAIEFVLDYLRFRFEGPVLTALIYPEMRMPDGEALRLGAAGYRDTFCEQIGTRVPRGVVEPDHELVLTFDGQASIAISVSDDDKGPSGEAAILDYGPDGKFWVW